MVPRTAAHKELISYPPPQYWYIESFPTKESCISHIWVMSHISTRKSEKCRAGHKCGAGHKCREVQKCRAGPKCRAGQKCRAGHKCRAVQKSGRGQSVGRGKSVGRGTSVGLGKSVGQGKSVGRGASLVPLVGRAQAQEIIFDLLYIYIYMRLFFVFSPLPAAGCGGDTAGVGAGLCVGGIGLLFDIFGAPPGDGATYTLQHITSHCSTLQRTATHVT